MNKDTNYYGIDISKDVFDVMDQKGFIINLKTHKKDS